MQNVLPRSGARAYTVSDDASVDQRYIDTITGSAILFRRTRPPLPDLQFIRSNFFCEHCTFIPDR